MVKVFYHGDLDGQCSAYWVRKFLESQNTQFSASDFIEMNYGKQLPISEISKDEQVFVVDFSFDPVQMMFLAEYCDLTWIDHHKTAIEKMAPYIDNYEINGIQEDGVAGCLLTWKYFNTHDEIHAPIFTWYIHLWDTWKWKDQAESFKNDIEAFVTGLMDHDVYPISDSNVWDYLNDDEILDTEYSNVSEGKIYMDIVIGKGRSMLKFRNGYARELSSSIGKLIDFEGYKCFVCNIAHCNSEWFKSVEDTYDILMPFYYNAQTKLFTISLYSSKVDVSKIATKYGGGGHAGASGFQCVALPF